MTNPALTNEDQVLINRAATLLDLVGRHADNAAGLMAIRSLRAADLLVCGGAEIATLRMHISSGDARAGVRQALSLLGMLSPDAFDAAAIVEATEAAQQAFASEA